MLTPNSVRIRARPRSSSTALVQAHTPDQAASANMTVQAGPKTQFGGFHCGLRRSAYQVPTVVVQPPTARTKITVALAITMGMAMGNSDGTDRGCLVAGLKKDRFQKFSRPVGLQQKRSILREVWR